MRLALVCLLFTGLASAADPSPAKQPGLPVGPGYHSVNPMLIVDDGAKAIDFYVKAFGAKELFRIPSADGKKLTHAEVRIGDSVVMLMDEFPEMGCIAAKTLGNTPVSMQLYVADVDAAFTKAVDAGAKAVMPPTDMFWGDRYSSIVDPFGQVWAIITRTKELTPEQMAQAQKAFDAQDTPPQGEHAPEPKPKLEER